VASKEKRSDNTREKIIEKAMKPVGRIVTQPPGVVETQPASTSKGDVDIRARRPDGPITTQPPTSEQTPAPKKSI